jgi:hypothetical protein
MKSLKMILMLCVLAQCVSTAWARPSMKTIRWLEDGELPIPSEVQQAQGPADLEKSLKSENEFVRAAAVRKLGELGGQQAVTRLLQIFRDESPLKAIEALPIVKMEAVRTLGRIGGKEAGSVMTSLLEDQWGKRPTAGGSAEAQWMAESCPVIGFLLKELPPYASDDRVLRAVESIANAQTLSHTFVTRRPDIGMNAWHICITSKMAREKMNEDGQMEYLFGFYDKLVEGGNKEGRWPVSTQFEAAHGILLRDHDITQLKAFSRQIQEKIDKYDVAQKKDAEYNTLVRRSSCIKRLLWEKSSEGKSNETGQRETPSR